MELNSNQMKILKDYSKLAKKLKAYPSLKEFTSTCDITRKRIRTNFAHGGEKENGTLSDVKKLAKIYFKDCFDLIPDDSLFNNQYYQNTSKELSKYRELLICSVQNNSPFNFQQYIQMRTMVQSKNQGNAKVCAIVVTFCNEDFTNVDRFIMEEAHKGNLFLVHENMRLNQNLMINTMKVNPTTADPVASLDAMAYGDGSIIVASPRFRAKRVSTDNAFYPSVLLSAPSLTLPNYFEDKKGKRLAKTPSREKADRHHKNGFLYVQLKNDKKTFNYTHVECASDGSFFLRGKHYVNSHVLEIDTDSLRPEAFVVPDLHGEDADPQAVETWVRIIKSTRPKRIFLHDTVSGNSITHHAEHDAVLQAKMNKEGRLCLVGEIKRTLKVVNKFTSLVGKYADEVVIVRSNHDEHIDKWVTERRGNSSKDINHAIYTKLYDNAINGTGEFALKYLFEKYADEVGVKNIDKIHWTKRDDDIRIGSKNPKKGVYMSLHGDIMRGSSNIKMANKNYGSIIHGHSHTTEIFNDAWSVGTSSYLKMHYLNGNSTGWTQSGILVHANGQKELYSLVNNQYDINEKDVVLKKAKDNSKAIAKLTKQIKVLQAEQSAL